MESEDRQRLWTQLYNPRTPTEISPDFLDALTMFRASVRKWPKQPIIRYFDGVLSLQELNEESDAFAAALLAHGFSRGDRLGIYLQNTPHFVIGIIGAWKAGGIAVPINPMNREDELIGILRDADIKILLCEEGSGARRVATILGSVPVRYVIPASPQDYQTRNDKRVLPSSDAESESGDLPTMRDLIVRYRASVIEEVTPDSGDAAFITYTSGTTAAPKGAVNTHGSVVFSAQVYREWLPLSTEDRILGLPPMTGITGLVVGLAPALLIGCTYILHYRFNLAVVLDAIAEHRPTFLLAPPTVFIALMNVPEIEPADVASLVKLYCGAAPVSPTLVKRWKDRFGQPIRTVYGLTEATGPTHIAPIGADIPVDPDTGALSVGIPIFNTDARIVDQAGQDLPIGEIGQLVIRGPQVIREYWHNNEETEKALKDTWLQTGDLAKMDHAGWFYIVDRIKNIIIASGYNVFPRQVEDVLHQHPGVREVAIIGAPDPYRGETVVGFVSLNRGVEASEEDLIQFTRERLSLYKCPTAIKILPELPKNANGKILHRELRDLGNGVEMS